MAPGKTKPARKKAPAAPTIQPPAGIKGLTIKLEPDLYLALRAHCYERERATGSRVTHQAVMVEALKKLLNME